MLHLSKFCNDFWDPSLLWFLSPHRVKMFQLFLSAFSISLILEENIWTSPSPVSGSYFSSDAGNPEGEIK